MISSRESLSEESNSEGYASDSASTSEDCAEVVVIPSQIALNSNDLKILAYLNCKFNVDALALLDLLYYSKKNTTEQKFDAYNSDVVLTSQDIDLMKRMNQDSKADVLAMLAMVHNKQVTQNSQERGIARIFEMMDLHDIPPAHKVIKPKDLSDNEVRDASVIGVGIFKGRIKRPAVEIEEVKLRK